MEKNKKEQPDTALLLEMDNLHLPIKKYGWQIHVVAWAILFLLPFLFTGRESDTISWRRYLDFAIMLCLFMLLFYVNYLYLVKRYLFAKQTGRFLLVNGALFVILLLAQHALFTFLPDEEMVKHRDHVFGVLDFIRIVLGNLIGYTFFCALSVAFRMTGRWYDAETERKELEKTRSEAELQNLKSQLNPHFLFNTLNNIYSLIAFSPEKAQEAVHELSRLLRYVMYESSQPLVAIEKDIDFVHNYVELMRIRLPEHVDLKVDIGAIVPGTLIAPLLFISLIENAFKHGVSNNKPSFIHIRLSQEGSKVSCSILNSDFHKNAEQDKSGSGIGLVNLERRLQLLYPDRYVYTCGAEEANYRTYLSITVNTVEP